MLKRLYLLPILALILALGLPSAGLAQKSPAQPTGQAAVGKVNVKLLAPEGLKRVDGLNPEVDAYIKKVEPKFKLNVLALYADPKEWDAFVANVKGNKGASIPKFAMICVPRKMAKKSFTDAAVRKEHKRYANWFSLVANNRPMAAVLTSQGNAKLKEFLGVDIGFKFKTDEFTKKFAETSNSLSLGAQVSFNVFGKTSKVFLTATSLQVADKMIFLAYFENSGPPDKLAEIQAKTIAWRSGVNSENYK